MSSDILFDVDGVAADFIRHVVGFLNQIATSMGDPATYSPEIPTFELEEWVAPKHLQPLYDLMAEPEFWLTIPVIPGAQEVIEGIRARDLNVYWVSKRSHYCPLWVPSREHWLKTNFGAKPADLIPTGNKHMIQGARFYDDKIEHVEAWENANPNGLAYLFDAPYNQNVVRTQRVNWDTIGQTL